MWLELLTAACLSGVFLAVVLPSVRGGSLLGSRGVVASVYVAMASVPLVLIGLGGRRLRLRVAGWLLLCLLLAAVIAF